MKRIASHRRPAAFPIASPEAENAGQRAPAEDSFDDEISEDLFDVEGEQVEVANIVHTLDRTYH